MSDSDGGGELGLGPRCWFLLQCARVARAALGHGRVGHPAAAATEEEEEGEEEELASVAGGACPSSVASSWSSIWAMARWRAAKEEAADRSSPRAMAVMLTPAGNSEARRCITDARSWASSSSSAESGAAGAGSGMERGSSSIFASLPNEEFLLSIVGVKLVNKLSLWI